MADLKLPRLNKALIAGRITQDLELKYTPKGTPVVRFTVAMDKNYKDDSDQWQTVPIYVEVVAWNNNAENICKYGNKGMAVMIEGRIETRSFVDSNNVNRKVFEVIAEHIQTLEWKPRAEGESTGDEVPLPDDRTQPAAPTTTDDVPF